MRNSSASSGWLIVALILTTFATAAGQQGSQEQIIVPMKSGYFVAFSTTPSGDSGGSNDWSNTFAEAFFESNTIRRVFVDSGGSLFFGYSLVIEPLAPSKQFKITIRPLISQDELELRTRKAFQGRSIHPNYNADAFARSASPQTISDGDTFALDLLVNPRTGEKVTDFVTVSVSDAQVKAAAARDIPPRDFTLSDVEMKMINYQLLINGELVAGGKASGACAGPVIWFYLTERGRFIFSLTPQEGYDFQKVGVIDRNKIKFTLKDERYEWISDMPVVGSGGPWNLYVLYDPNYVPDSYFLGVNGAERAPKRSDPLTGIAKVERALRLPRKPTSSGLDNSVGPNNEARDRATVRPRLILGGASRVENLLPVNTSSFVQPGLRDNYARWIYEDVAYIITSDEARAFRQLQLDDQRELFIERFWLSRDPDPSTQENEYRKEYYSRFAYANENFAFSDVAGWRTDRGRIYILYGRPDEVETVPTGERWNYKRKPNVGTNGMFEFVDVNGRGELRLRPAKPN